MSQAFPMLGEDEFLAVTAFVMIVNHCSKVFPEWCLLDSINAFLLRERIHHTGFRGCYENIPFHTVDQNSGSVAVKCRRLHELVEDFILVIQNTF